MTLASLHMRSRRGQISLEYMMVAVILTSALVVVFAVAFGLFSEQKAALQVAEARTAANGLAEMANFLCTAPRNTTSRASIFIPSFTDLTQSSIDNRTIKFFVKSRDADSVVTSTTLCNVTGTFPSVSGTYVFRGVSTGGYGGSVTLNYTLEIKRPTSG
ncbi:MAG: hypothetical protein HY366_02805 [Candidatus Aenigmarchaeota archaeon]|nr:hypothetical protein [Candidatus Aenigmarchaeota archaeon]